MMQISFNKPSYTGDEEQFILDSIKSDKISGNGKYTKKVESWFEENLSCKKALLTTSCTHALEMAAMLINIKEGDEVIMPSYTFVSSANAFTLRGAKVVFVDIRPDTMNIDETKIEAAITKKTKAILPVHYAGIACEMDSIMDIAQKYNLFVIEDAAQAMMSSYKGKALGTIGHLGAYSFHETKNYTSAGEGGLLIINDDAFSEQAEIIREKGTNRALFFQGKVDKYSWVGLGSSYLISDMSAAYLWGQLLNVEKIKDDRVKSWFYYFKGLQKLASKKSIELSQYPTQNGHIFYIKLKNLEERTQMIQHLENHNINAVFHYVPLHTSPAGKKFTRFHGNDIFTTSQSDRLLRLPIYFGLSTTEMNYIIHSLYTFYQKV